MFSRLSLSFSAALLLSAVGGVAWTAPAPAHSNISAADSGIPDSTEFSKRIVSSHSPSNEEINAAESGNPDSVNCQQGITSPSPKSEKSWQTLEIGNPDFR
jgi:hypothetical protein